MYPQLDTPRLSLGVFNPEDASRVQALAGVFEVADTTASIPHPYPDGVAAAWIAQHPAFWAAGLSLSLAIRRRDDGLLLGAIGLQSLDSVPELGYWLGLPFWGRGYATEAAAALCDFTFASLPVNLLVGRHLARNPASGRVMQKLGMQDAGESQAVVRGRHHEAVVHYRIERTAWQRLRQTDDKPTITV
ncbi:GNAT family N-acetyltransferase [Jeongeupia naejangsanensis]|uniref:GNAT family N-acetyltransferase n=1 Tax=Jeongeupia naejangsanensis TaxID=613195 RepID=A0ABS2BQ45_9NEIS|nr:GNAT family N-acetyltransferase [Jeongeupia naejangsanensis]MBM3117560.1 GNAT family N-acetyltransferase [Jeongeupia naejangsanensis]